MKALLLSTLLLAPALTFAQGVGIGTTTPNASAALDVSSTSKGLLPPRMTQAQRDAIASPAAGLLVFNTSTGLLNQWDGLAWTGYLAGISSALFTYTGAVQYYTVPTGVTSLLVELTGAAGNGGMYTYQNGTTNPSIQSSGGLGGRVQATLSVTGGQRLAVYVGGAGSGTAAGFNGGGSGYTNGAPFAASGGGGGGASDVRTNSFGLADRVLVAGGGGGGGSNDASANGGCGGGLTACNGGRFGSTGGGGGSQSSGGSGGGSGSIASGAGTAGSGGSGNTYGGCGGGGGYYGGGGGSTGTFYYYPDSNTVASTGGGAGGGSSYAGAGTSTVAHTQGYQAGNGYVRLTPQGGLPAPLLNAGNFVNVPGDNLGNHTATTTLNLQANALTGTGAVISGLGLGVRADGGLNIGQNTPNGSIYLGYLAGAANTGGYNLFAGSQAGQVNSSGAGNVFLGQASGLSNTTGSLNTYTGTASGQSATGSNNTFTGYASGFNVTTGSANTALGYQSGPASGSLTNTLALGANASVSTSNTIQLGDANITNLYCKVNLVATSDARFKYDVQANVPGLAFITRLRPVTYRFDDARLSTFEHTGQLAARSAPDTAAVVRTGFLAQEVAAAARQVGFRFDGVHTPANARDHYGLGYAQFVVPLVRAVQEQQQQIEELKAQNAALRNANQALQTGSAADHASLLTLQAQMARLLGEGVQAQK